jgi:hypothetical protein
MEDLWGPRGPCACLWTARSATLPSATRVIEGIAGHQSLEAKLVSVGALPSTPPALAAFDVEL